MISKIKDWATHRKIQINSSMRQFALSELVIFRSVYTINVSLLLPRKTIASKKKKERTKSTGLTKNEE